MLLPLHPRTRARLAATGLRPTGSVEVVPPASYLDMLVLLRRARAVAHHPPARVDLHEADALPPAETLLVLLLQAILPDLRPRLVADEQRVVELAVADLPGVADERRHHRAVGVPALRRRLDDQLGEFEPPFLERRDEAEGGVGE